MAEINMNQMATVTLTRKGAELYNYIKKPAKKVYGGFVLKTELWCLFEIFGQHMYNGCIIPFKDNKITLEKL